MVNIFHGSKTGNDIRGERGPPGPKGDPGDITLANKGGIVQNQKGELMLAHLKLLYWQGDAMLRDDPRSYKLLYITIFIGSGIDRYLSSTFVMSIVGANPILPIMLEIGDVFLSIQTKKDSHPFRHISQSGMTSGKRRWNLISVHGSL